MLKNLSANAGDMGSIPGLGRSPGENGNPCQYSCLGNPMDRGAWWAIVLKYSLKFLNYFLQSWKTDSHLMEILFQLLFYHGVFNTNEDVFVQSNSLILTPSNLWAQGCAEKPFLQKNKALIFSIYQFSWCTYSLYFQFQGWLYSTTSLQYSLKFSNHCLSAGTN